MGISSETIIINYSVPEGSIPSPLMFNCYTSTIQEIMPIDLSGYADDHSLTESLKPASTMVKENLECNVNNVRKLMTENHLKMNNSKTKFMGFSTRYNLDKHTIPSLKAGDSDIINKKDIKFLGTILDPHLTFKDHIANKSEIALHNLSLIHNIRNLLTEDQLKMLMCSLVLTHLVYSKAILVNSPDAITN